ncbi:MAG: hypothetical protein DRH56_09305 [Deltaproteobacteria bacterium]|nr:MAG: hypothetical protein DRH56_09305 [Deltaproteobacteria bacterium]
MAPSHITRADGGTDRFPEPGGNARGRGLGDLPVSLAVEFEFLDLQVLPGPRNRPEGMGQFRVGDLPFL